MNGHGVEVLAQQVASSGEWNANASNVALFTTAEALVRWPGMGKNGGHLQFEFSGTYLFQNGTTITEDVWLFLAIDGTPFHTFKLTAIASTPTAFGAFYGTIALRSSGVARQECFSFCQLVNPSNTGATPQTWRQIDRYIQDFSVNRRISLQFQKQAATSSQFNMRSVDAWIRSRRS